MKGDGDEVCCEAAGGFLFKSKYIGKPFGREGLNKGWRVQLKFQLGLHIKDYNLLCLLNQYLGNIGSIHLARNRNIANYSIDSIKDLNKLISLLDSYPLLTQATKGDGLILFYLKK